MSSHIPQDYIDDLIARVDLAALIKHYLPLEPAGNEFKARCPFHDEKTPSFHVVPLKHFYHCFGCNAHGTAITFLMQFARIGFSEAIEQLAHSVGLPPPQETQHTLVSAAADKPLLNTLTAAADWYQQQLRTAHNSAAGYLRKRGLDGRVATLYAIGYAPPGWDNLLRALGGDDAKRGLLLETGLTVPNQAKGSDKKNSAYDRFRNRIMFPVHDSQGRIIGFGGRALDDGGDSDAKYINSPQSRVFHKKQVLYGLHQARQYSHKARRILITEGYMDVLALAQFGLRESVATLGTAITREHIQQLFRTCTDIIFCFDGDSAGRAAAWRALKNTLPLLHGENQAKFLFLPNDHDPDSLIRGEGAAAFEKRLAGALSTSDYLFRALQQDVDINSPEGRSRMTVAAQPLLRQIPAGPYYQQMQQRLLELCGDQHSATAAIQGRYAAFGRKPKPKPRDHDHPIALETQAICILLHHPGSASSPRFKASLVTAMAVPATPELALLKELIVILQSHAQLNTGQLVERFRDHPMEALIDACIGRQPSVARRIETCDTEQELLTDINDCLSRIARREAKQHRVRRFKALSSKPLEALDDAEKAELQKMYRTAVVER